MTVSEALQEASRQIPRRDAELLLTHQLQTNRAWLLAHPEAEIGFAEYQALQSSVVRRAQHWPLQYLTGTQEFFGLPLRVTPATLIPRPETELLVEAVLAWLAQQGSPQGDQASWQIVDVGTGTGAIALALASRLPKAAVTAIDLSQEVRAVVQHNAAHLGLAGQVCFLESDLLQKLQPRILAGRRLDVVVSNPPYVPLADAASLAPEVRDFEPHLALFAGQDGLAVYRRLVPEAWNALRPGGLLALEFGFGQRDALEELLASWSRVQFSKDYAGIHRIVLAERPTEPPA